MHDTFSNANSEPSTMELIVDQLEELLVTIIDEVRQRPGVAVATRANQLLRRAPVEDEPGLECAVSLHIQPRADLRNPTALDQHIGAF